jgi:hypothetical protein
MKIRKPNQMVYVEGDSAFDVLLKAKIQSEKNGWEEVTISEFDRDETLSLGGDVPRSTTISGETLRQFDVGKITAATINAANSIEKMVGVPALAPVQQIGDLKLQPIESIVERLSKLKKRAKRHVKSLKKMSDTIDECQDPEILGGISILETILNGGNVLDIKAIVSHLQSLFVKRERDKLYYVLKYPTNPKMHLCQNLEILASIREGIECLTDNPFISIPCHGSSRYAY